MSSAEEEDARRRLRASNAWGKIKARYEAELFACLPEAHASMAVPNDRGRRFHDTRDGRLAAGVVRDVLEALGMESTLRVFETECGISSPLGRAEVDRELGIDHPTSSQPLLVEVLRRFSQRAVAASEPVDPPTTSSSAPVPVPPSPSPPSPVAPPPPSPPRPSVASPELSRPKTAPRNAPRSRPAIGALVERDANDLPRVYEEARPEEQPARKPASASPEVDARPSTRGTRGDSDRSSATSFDVVDAVIAREQAESTAMTGRVTLTPSSFADEAPKPKPKIERPATRPVAPRALDGSYELDESGEVVEELDESVDEASVSDPPELELDEDDATPKPPSLPEDEEVEIDYHDASVGDVSFAAESAPIEELESVPEGASLDDEDFELDVEDVY